MVNLEGVALDFVNMYKDFILSTPAYVGIFFKLLFLILIVLAYSIFVWKFYRFIATKNFLELNLAKYNTSQQPAVARTIGIVFYFFEYILILPFLIFFWFAVFAIFLIVLTDSLTVDTVIIISATVIAVIRMTAYYKEDLSKDIAKLLPFTLLSVSILSPGFFNIERIIGHIASIPEFFGEIMLYLFLIIAIEIILRFFDFIFSLFGLEEELEPYNG